MTPTSRGSLRVLRFAGIDICVHWSWLVVAAVEIKSRSGQFGSLLWNLLEYLALFGAVLLHELGHALACRSVGGQADQIVLWPLGGVAYVTPPARPAATLWSIAAGPLVNLVLLVVTGGILAVWPAGNSDARVFLTAFAFINLGLLIFNVLPIYPLDGGKVLHALLWFVLGRATSLMVAAGIGLVGVLALFGVAVAHTSLWMGLMAIFALMSCWRGLGQARVLARLARLPRRHGFACPACKSVPPVAELWSCSQCRLLLDTFAHNGACPNCGQVFGNTHCPYCGRAHPLQQWSLPEAATNNPPVTASVT